MNYDERADTARMRELHQREEHEERATRTERPQFIQLIHKLEPFAVQNLRSNVIPIRGSLLAYHVFVHTINRHGKVVVSWGDGVFGGIFEEAQIVEDGTMLAPCQATNPFIPERCSHIRHLRGMTRLLHVMATAVPNANYDRTRRAPGPNERHRIGQIGLEVVSPPQAYDLPPSYPTQELRKVLYSLPPLPLQRRRGWL